MLPPQSRRADTSTQVASLLAYGSVADEVRQLATRLITRLELLHAQYPSEELEQALHELKRWQSRLA
jgi:hypothetical protein